MAVTFVKVGVGIAILVGLCAVLGLGELRIALGRMSPLGFLLFLLASAAVFLTYAIRWRFVLEALGETPPGVGTLFLCRASGHAASTLLPSAQLSGEPVRVVLLRRHGLDWEASLLGVGLDRLLEASAGAIMGPLYVAAFLWSIGASTTAIASVLALWAAAVAGVGVVWTSAAWGGRATAWLARRGWLPSPGVRPGHPDRGPQSSARQAPAIGRGPTGADDSDGRLQAVGERVARFVRSRRFAACFGLSLFVEALLLLEFRALTAAFGMEISWPVIGAVLVGMGAAHLVPIPGAIGSLEAVQVGIVRLSGGAAGLGLALGLLVRLRETLWLLVGAAYAWAQGFDALAATASGKTAAIEAKPSDAKSR